VDKCGTSFLKEILRGPYEDENGPICSYCHEPILPGEKLTEVEGPAIHFECGFRITYGSVGHLTEQCPCHGKEDHSEDGLTLREGAKASLEHCEQKKVAS